MFQNIFVAEPIVELVSDSETRGKIKGMELLDPVVLAGQMSCAYVRMDGHTEFKPHTHPSAHILYVLEGSGFYSFVPAGAGIEDMQVEKIFPGDVIPVPAGLERSVSAFGEGCAFISVSSPARTLDNPERIRYVRSCTRT